MASRALFVVILVFIVSVFGPCTTHAEPEKKETEVAQKAQVILKTNCYRCHGQNDSVSGGFDHVLNPQRLLATKKVVPGKPDESKLYKQMVDQVMPPKKDADGNPVKQRPTKEEIAAIKEWIEAGAPDFKK
jgi:mono/diheme cytochrome c family protein